MFGGVGVRLELGFAATTEMTPASLRLGQRVCWSVTRPPFFAHGGPVHPYPRPWPSRLDPSLPGCQVWLPGVVSWRTQRPPLPVAVRACVWSSEPKEDRLMETNRQEKRTGSYHEGKRSDVAPANWSRIGQKFPPGNGMTNRTRGYPSTFL